MNVRSRTKKVPMYVGRSPGRKSKKPDRKDPKTVRYCGR
jgi:hypothetical protein